MTTVWVCINGTDYETSSVEAVYQDVHGARSWMKKERAKCVRAGRKQEREEAELDGRKPDYSTVYTPSIRVNKDGERFDSGSEYFWIRPMKVKP